jgi:acyl-CoA-binding protein
MKTAAVLGLVMILAAASGAVFAASGQRLPGAASNIQPVSWDAWLAVKAKAEENDAAGNYVAALQYYLEYARQAQGLNSPARVAWGKNNAAYMIIKMHKQDPTVDLAPAERLLKEGLALEGATEDCRKIMAMNLEHVLASLGTPR